MAEGKEGETVVRSPAITFADLLRCSNRSCPLSSTILRPKENVEGKGSGVGKLSAIP